MRAAPTIKSDGGMHASRREEGNGCGCGGDGGGGGGTTRIAPVPHLEHAVCAFTASLSRLLPQSVTQANHMLQAIVCACGSMMTTLKAR